MELYSTPLAKEVIGCAIEVHQIMGPGLLESTYRRCLAREFGLRQVRFVEEVPVPVEYKGMALGIGHRIDFVVGEELVVELKSVERLLPLHSAQVLTYLAIAKHRQGLLINFNVARLKEGIRSLLNPRMNAE